MYYLRTKPLTYTKQISLINCERSGETKLKYFCFMFAYVQKHWRGEEGRGKGEATPTLTIAGGSPLLTMSMLCLMHTKGKVFSGNLLAGDVEIYS